MSPEPAGDYKLEHIPAATQHIEAIAAAAKQAGKLAEFKQILFEAVRRLTNDPHGWGDPEFHKLVGGGIVCHGILRPIVFYYVIYESLRSVVLLEVHQFAEFE